MQGEEEFSSAVQEEKGGAAVREKGEDIRGRFTRQKGHGTMKRREGIHISRMKIQELLKKRVTRSKKGRRKTVLKGGLCHARKMHRVTRS